MEGKRKISSVPFFLGYIFPAEQGGGKRIFTLIYIKLKEDRWPFNGK
jgi:hypothetical protein